MSAQAYLDSLLAPAGEPGPATQAYREWEAALAAWEAGDQALNKSTPTARPLPDPIPTLHSLLGADGLDVIDRVDDDAGVDLAEAVSRLDIAPEAGPSHAMGDVSGLLGRIHNHLQPTAFVSLLELLESPRPDDEIQIGLVEILGFEGNGLSLVEEILKPGVRQDLVSLERGGIKKQNGHQPHRSGRKKIDITDMIGSAEDIERRIQEQLSRPKDMFVPVEQQRQIRQPTEDLPNVFMSGMGATHSMSYGGRLAAPEGTTREERPSWTEVTIPPPKMVPPKIGERPVLINRLPPLARKCFPGYTTLNRMQSVVQPTAMNTNENMLVCAPTGAGKTDVAIMTIIRVLQSHVRDGPSTHPSGFNIDRDAFKIVYVAPMKALAAEITRKFGKRLAWLDIKVRELTGDMQMTRQEIAETQIIITTPEKWDVVTRKPTGEGELASKVRLLIIDEVHLLNEDRGAVIETIVARTLRQVESSQSLIRIVGLSATLPNYIDVSDFLRVNRYQGLFFFDSAFRPVPLEQHFIGVKGKARSTAQTRNLENAVFEKVLDMVRQGHQVMVFVHARKETVKTAQRLREMAHEEGALDLFDMREHPKFQLYRRDVGTSRNKEMKELFDSGFGIHHAGMLRSDRSMTERLFEDNAIKVLCCTSTLAWGVNLPAHAVIIKGTQVYDSTRGAFVDLSVLDVLQIFGRAGRPGYETEGVGYICTSEDRLEHYVEAIMSQKPIESKFQQGINDSLNAEIALGTITNVREGISWIGYTYLFVRMRKEPMNYGMTHEEPKDDPQLGNKRTSLITDAALALNKAKMIRYDQITNNFVISDLGRIAARYYIRYQTVEVFNEKFNPRMKNADLFAMLSMATEFEQVQVRDSEIDELTNLMSSDSCPMEVMGGATNKHGKVNILLQAHISRALVNDFALVSDMAYVAQNAGRIIRALLEIALSRNWANCAYLLIDLSKAIERRMWPYQHPLRQSMLQRETLFALDQYADEIEPADMREMDSEEIGRMLHMNAAHGEAVRKAALEFPTVGVEYALRPLAHDLLQISVTVNVLFRWNHKVSGSAEPFYVWVQDEEGIHILQWRSILLRPSTNSLSLDFVVPWRAEEHQSLTIITASDKWLGSDSQTVVSLVNLIMPRPFEDGTKVLDLPFLSISALDDPALERAYRDVSNVPMLNGMQSQVFWSMYHTHHNVLVSAPVASGKSFLGEVAIWHTFRHEPAGCVIVVVPDRRAVDETAGRIRSVAPRSKKITVHAIGGLRRRDQKEQDTLARLDLSAQLEEAVGSSGGRVLVTTPRAFDDIAHERLANLGRQISLILLEDVHLMDAEYELAMAKLVSVAQPARTRMVALTSTLADPTDLGTLLRVDPNMCYCFAPKDRGSPIVVQLKTFTIPHSATMLKSMVKPTYDIIKNPTSGNVIVFVPSRAACRSVAKDLVTQSGTEMDLNGFLTAPREDIEPFLARLVDQTLLEPLLHGVGYVMKGMAQGDFALVLELYASGILRALITPRDMAWNLVVRASTVVLMGAQYIRYDRERDDRTVVAYSRHELVRMQGLAAQSAHPAAGAGKMFVMCQAEQQTGIARVLADGLPLESSLAHVLSREPGYEHATAVLERMLKHREPPRPTTAHRPRQKDLRKRDMMDLLAFYTLLSRRVRSNPTFYDMIDTVQTDAVSRLVDKFFDGLGGTVAAGNAKAAKGKAKEKAGPKTNVDGPSGSTQPGAENDNSHNDQDEENHEGADDAAENNVVAFNLDAGPVEIEEVLVEDSDSD